MENVIKMNGITVNDLESFFQKGRFATVVFEKVNGETRVLNGKTKVFRAIRGGGERYDAKARGQLRVCDVNVYVKGFRELDYRTVTAERVKEVRSNGKIYVNTSEINSSEAWVTKPRYDEAQKMFNITLNGTQYTYLEVSKDTVKKFVNSENWGVAFNELIRGKYDFLKG